MKIDYLDAVAPRIVKVAAKRRLQFEFVFARDLFAYFRDLLFVAHHDSKMSHPAGMQFFYFEHGEELMFAELEKGVAFAAVHLLEIENVLIKRDRLLDVVHFNGDVIATVNLYTHVVMLLRVIENCRVFLSKAAIGLASDSHEVHKGRNGYDFWT